MAELDIDSLRLLLEHDDFENWLPLKLTHGDDDELFIRPADDPGDNAWGELWVNPEMAENIITLINAVPALVGIRQSEIEQLEKSNAELRKLLTEECDADYMPTPEQADVVDMTKTLGFKAGAQHELTRVLAELDKRILDNKQAYDDLMAKGQSAAATYLAVRLAELTTVRAALVTLPVVEWEGSDA